MSATQAPELLRRNERAPMQYRRFGRTNRALSVITLGGMRYYKGWDAPRDELPARSIEQCKDTVIRALEAGINHIETAHGYGKSEHLYGKVLNEELRVPRDRYFMMTKGAPETADATRRLSCAGNIDIGADPAGKRRTRLIARPESGKIDHLADDDSRPVSTGRLWRFRQDQACKFDHLIRRPR